MVDKALLPDGAPARARMEVFASFSGAKTMMAAKPALGIAALQLTAAKAFAARQALALRARIFFALRNFALQCFSLRVFGSRISPVRIPASRVSAARISSCRKFAPQVFALQSITLCFCAPIAFAGEAQAVNAGDTAWMLTATALVLLMTLPGLALFYGGMVRSKNVLSVLMQCFAIAGLITVLWTIYGYSLTFDTTGMQPGVLSFSSFIGGFDKAMLAGLTLEATTGTIPESVFATFQMTFAIITPALIVGAFAERMKFSAMLAFMTLWFTFCYAPIAHMVWSGDGALLWDWGVLDFAGGTVVHINAGMAGLIAALMLGRRRGYGTLIMAPHNLALTMIGGALLWVGWFGFNAGSALAAGASAGMALLVTQICTGTAALTWMVSEWLTHRKPSLLGVVSGAIAGLVGITPACGSVGPPGALAIGIASGALCFLAATKLKPALGFDDALDVFGVHCVGGIVGALLTGIFAFPALGGVWTPGPQDTPAGQLWIQTKGVLFTLIYTGVVTYAILKPLDLLMGLRVSAEQEEEGLDLSLHDERGYSL